jgi:hypothetical protein
MTTGALAILAAAVFLKGSSSDPTSQPSPAPCPALSVTADGKKLDLPVGLGARLPEARGGGYVVSLFNHDKIDCTTYLQTSRWAVPNELEVAAYVGPTMTNVRANISNALGVPAFIVTLPQKAGAAIAICVPQPVEHDPEVSEGHRVEVRIQGLLSGEFCGDAQ